MNEKQRIHFGIVRESITCKHITFHEQNSLINPIQASLRTAIYRQIHCLLLLFVHCDDGFFLFSNKNKHEPNTNRAKRYFKCKQQQQKMKQQKPVKFAYASLLSFA